MSGTNFGNGDSDEDNSMGPQGAETAATTLPPPARLRTPEPARTDNPAGDTNAPKRRRAAPAQQAARGPCTAAESARADDHQDPGALLEDPDALTLDAL